jgi:hypothetical protein
MRIKNFQKNVTGCFVFLLVTTVSYSQAFDVLKIGLVQSYYDSNYADCIKKAKALEKKYPERITANDLYLTAISFARTGNKEKSIEYLEKSILKGPISSDKLKQDSIVFKPFYGSAQWNATQTLIEQKKVEREKLIKYPVLADELSTMLVKDQEIRLLMSKFFENGVARIPDSLSGKQRLNDSLNLARLKEIVTSIGWPGKSLVGDKGAIAAFLIAQHADKEPETQTRFLALLKKSVHKNDAEPQHLAYLTDRVARAKNEPQTYGTQAWINPKTKKFEMAPIKDKTNVDKRRMLLGLPPLKIYKAQLGIKD